MCYVKYLYVPHIIPDLKSTLMKGSLWGWYGDILLKSLYPFFMKNLYLHQIGGVARGNWWFGKSDRLALVAEFAGDHPRWGFTLDQIDNIETRSESITHAE